MTDSLRIRIADALRTMMGDLTYEAMADAVIRELGLRPELGQRSKPTGPRVRESRCRLRGKGSR